MFRKGEEARYLSHLDLMSTLEFSLRRARLPLELSEGFNPRPRMSLVAPLPLGYVGEREILELSLSEHFDLAEIASRLSATVPTGITIGDVIEVAPEGKSAASRLRSATYYVELAKPVGDLRARIYELLDRYSLEIEEERDGTLRKRDLRPAILDLKAVSARAFVLVAGYDGGTVRPEQILGLMGIDADGARITRQSIEVA